MMLYSRGPSAKQDALRQRCRNPNCGAELKYPAPPRFAFCCEKCEQSYFSTHCRVCNEIIARKPGRGRRRIVCWRSRCRHEFQRRPELYWTRAEMGQKSQKQASRYPSATGGQKRAESLTKSTPKTAQKSGRAWRVVAGPPGLEPRSFWAATLPLDEKVAERVERDLNRLRAHIRALSARAIIQYSDAPVNILDGYRFPNAPAVDLGPITPAVSVRVTVDPVAP